MAITHSGGFTVVSLVMLITLAITTCCSISFLWVAVCATILFSRASVRNGAIRIHVKAWFALAGAAVCNVLIRCVSVAMTMDIRIASHALHFHFWMDRDLSVFFHKLLIFIWRNNATLKRAYSGHEVSPIPLLLDPPNFVKVNFKLTIIFTFPGHFSVFICIRSWFSTCRIV